MIASTRRSVSLSMCANTAVSKATVMLRKKKLKETDAIKSDMTENKENVINVSRKHTASPLCQLAFV